MEQIMLHPIGIVRNQRQDIIEDHWGGVVSEIILDDSIPGESLQGIESFSHIEILFYFDRVESKNNLSWLRHPRGNLDWPEVGVFAQRNKDRPNHIGLATARLIRRSEHSLFVEDQDAINGTPVFDIKPVMREFLARTPIQQPDWSHELMKDYWESIF